MFRRVLIANRGEIAVRIARAAATLGIESVAIYSTDDAESLHIRLADHAHPLERSGAAAYLDVANIARIARDTGCDAVHPGYGFLSERGDFARACADAGVTFVGPRDELLELFGDKVRARSLAMEAGIPLLAGSGDLADAKAARRFFETLGPNPAMMIKAAAGGGGRGMRPVTRSEDIEEAFERCRSEALASFGRGELYAERLVRRARHIEVQVIGDQYGALSHLWERDCTLQRRNQKIVEVAPAPELSPGLRARLLEAAVSLATQARYENLGTFEFLVDCEAAEGENDFTFMEANPRLQVEHTITEAVTGLDLVAAQFRVAAGEALDDIGLGQDAVPAPQGIAIQFRVNLETIGADGQAMPSAGTLTSFDPPSGPDVRVDSFAYTGYRTSTSFDPLLAKLIIRSSHGLPAALDAADRALSEFRIEGPACNIGFLRKLVACPDLRVWDIDTRYVEHHAAELAALPDPAGKLPGFEAVKEDKAAIVDVPEGLILAAAPMTGLIVAIQTACGDEIRAGQPVAIIEAMKMEQVVVAPQDGIVQSIEVAPGDTLSEGAPIAFILPADVGSSLENIAASVDLDAPSPGLEGLLARRAALQDEARPDAVARRRQRGKRTARENMAALFDDGDYLEYGEFAVAAQRSRRSRDELERISPADGLICGIGHINGSRFADHVTRAVGMAYDFTVLAGTQGYFNHAKLDRMLELAHRFRLPVVLYGEGGGGRPGDVDWLTASSLDVDTFRTFGSLSGLVPLIGILSGRCFAGNAALVGSSDVIIATRDANLGMAGPAMIEAAGLGSFRPEDVGPVSVQAQNGVIDVVVDDELEAARIARQYLSYFQGPLGDWAAADQRQLRHVLPANRLRTYDIRKVIECLCDTGSVLELRRAFAPAIITAFIRIEGRPMGLIANNCAHLGGAIDADGADKVARFLQLCDAFDMPILSLCDTPGFMVGPEAERTAQVRHMCRLFVTAASITVPFFSVILRKGYGLGVQGVVGGSFHTPLFTASWPTGEFGPMGLEGGVRLGFKQELDACSSPEARQALFQKLLDEAYARGAALNVAEHLEIDTVIDPAETRSWVVRGLRAAPPVPARTGKKRPCIDTW